MHDIADKIIELRLCTRRACMCESTQNTKTTISLKTKVMFLIDKNCSTKEIIGSLAIAKTNLALLTSSMEKEGLIVKTQSQKDKREKSYSLTDKGKKYLEDRKNAINLLFKNIITSESDYEDAIQKFDNVLEILSFIGY